MAAMQQPRKGSATETAVNVLGGLIPAGPLARHGYKTHRGVLDNPSLLLDCRFQLLKGGVRRYY